MDRKRRDLLFIGLEDSHKRFSLTTTILITTISLSCKLLFKLSSVRIINGHYIDSAIVHRSDNRSLITVSNHPSTLDDPVIWAVLPLRFLLDNRNLRWGLAAHDVCFKTSIHSWFFSRLQALPVTRGNGIYQPSVNHALDIMHDK